MKTKRIISLLLGFVMVLALLPAAAADEVIEITTVAQLKELAVQINASNDQKGKYYLLKNDLDFGGSESSQWTPIGYFHEYLRKEYAGFAGTFDGGGHTIRGLYIDADTVGEEANYTKGLFGYVDSGTVKNLTVDGFIRGDSYVGLVVAYNSHGTVENCHSMGVVRDSFLWVGGIVGGAGGTAVNCYNTGAVTGDEYVGGVAGYILNTTVACGGGY